MKALEIEAVAAANGKIPVSKSGRLSLRVNFSWTLAGNVAYAASQWAILVMLAKLASPEAVGQFALGMAIAAPVVMFTNMNLRTVQATDALKEFSFADYSAHRLLSTLVAVFTLLAIAFSGSYKLETAVVILCIGAAKAFESLSDICYGLAQACERMDRVAISMLMKSAVSLLLAGLAVFLTASPIWAAAALLAAWALVFLQFDLDTVKLLCRQGAEAPAEVRPRIHLETLKRMTLMALPLGIAMMLLSLSVNIPRYFLDYYSGEYQLGIFSAMAYVVVAGLTVVHALGQSASPRLSRFYASGDHQAFILLLWKVASLGLFLGIGSVLLSAIFGVEILTILYRPEYAAEQGSFFWLMVAGAISYVTNFLGYGICATRAFHRQLIPFVLVVVVTAFCSWIWVPAYGVRGAVWAFGAGNVVNLVLFLVVLASILHERSHACVVKTVEGL